MEKITFMNAKIIKEEFKTEPSSYMDFINGLTSNRIVSTSSTFTVEAFPDKNQIICKIEDSDSSRSDISKYKVIFNGPCTIIMEYESKYSYSRNRIEATNKLIKKTIVRTQDGEKYDKEKGLLMCLAKHTLSSQDFTDIFKEVYHKPKFEKAVCKSVLTYIYGKNTINEFLAKWL